MESDPPRDGGEAGRTPTRGPGEKEEQLEQLRGKILLLKLVDKHPDLTLGQVMLVFSNLTGLPLNLGKQYMDELVAEGLIIPIDTRKVETSAHSRK